MTISSFLVGKIFNLPRVEYKAKEDLCFGPFAPERFKSRETEGDMSVSDYFLDVKKELGCITKFDGPNQYKNFWLHDKEYEQESVSTAMWQVGDKNKNGYLEQGEYNNLYARAVGAYTIFGNYYNEKQMQAVQDLYNIDGNLEGLDKDSDGHVARDEFDAAAINHVLPTYNANEDVYVEPEKTLETLQAKFKDVQKQQGFIGRIWDKFKTTTGLGLGSDDIESLIKEYEAGNISYEEVEEQIKLYKEKQNGTVDIVANVVSTAAVVGTGVLTGGLSLLGGAVVGGTIKTALKTADRRTNKIEDDDFNLKQMFCDFGTGAFNGALSTGLFAKMSGPVVGQSVASAAKTGILQGAGSGTIIGGASGAVDYTNRCILDEDTKFTFKDLMQSVSQGALIGCVLGSVTGGISGGVAQAKFNSPKITQLARSLNIQAGDKDASKMLSEYLSRNRGLDIDGLNDYIQNIDMNELYKIAPEIQNYNPEQLLHFFDYHFKNNSLINADSLAQANLTEYLRQNHLDADDLSELFDAQPLTSRQVGDIPDGWLSNLSEQEQKEATAKIYEAISRFNQSRDVSELSDELSGILGKNVTVKELGSGLFGTGYQTSVEGAQDTVLKVFKGQSEIENAVFKQVGGFIPEKQVNHMVQQAMKKARNMHGVHVEPQTGLFANEYSDEFVKMYFGQVAPNGSTGGFMVTQFLDDTVTPVSTGCQQGVYNIAAIDAYTKNPFSGEKYISNPGNVIGDKIIDFGGLKIKHTGIEGVIETLEDMLLA